MILFNGNLVSFDVSKIVNLFIFYLFFVIIFYTNIILFSYVEINEIILQNTRYLFHFLLIQKSKSLKLIHFNHLYNLHGRSG